MKILFQNSGDAHEDTSLFRTPMFSPKLVISIHFVHCNRDTSQLSTAGSPKYVLSIEILLY
jgi:hypothetical protein